MRQLPYKLDPSLFTAYMWEGASIYTAFGFHLRNWNIARYKNILSAHIVGICKGEDLSYKRKADHMAVMFEKGTVRWWIHLQNREFNVLIK